MRNLLAALLTFFVITSLHAGRLDVAVIQFPEEKSTEALDAALAGADLFALTDGNKTRTSESYLKGGYVLFAQSFPLANRAEFATSTRLKDDRADVKGRYQGGTLSVEISLMAGLKTGLRNFERRTYSGTGALPAGDPRVIGLRRIKGKSTAVLKGDSTVKRYETTTVVVAQYRP